MVARFQSPTGTTAMVISLRAGGTGLNLTRANHVFHYDRWWNPAVEDQATDRAFRIGQTRDVAMPRMVIQGTMEEQINQPLDDKRTLAGRVVDTGETWLSELDDDTLRALLTLGGDRTCGFRQFWHRFSENSGTARAWGLVSSNGGTVEDDEPAVMQSAVEDRSCEVGVV